MNHSPNSQNHPPFLLLAGIAAGMLAGFFLKKDAAVFKPLGDIFLNLLFTAVVPLVFFSLSTAVLGRQGAGKTGRIFSGMLLVFVTTGILASVVMIAGVSVFPPAVTPTLLADWAPGPVPSPAPGNKLVELLTVPDFFHLLSKGRMPALIVFSLLTGLAVSSAGDRGKAFEDFLISGNQVMMKLISLIMKTAPAGLGAYFAYLTGSFGPELGGAYFRAAILYYPLAFFYFFAAFSAYTFWAGGKTGLRTFWANVLTPALTAFGTGSSLAALPSNLQASERIGIPEDIRKIVLPVGATLHMEGSCLAAILKISVLFGFFGREFAGFETLALAAGTALLCGIVMSGIPGGGFLGEVMIITLYGFPPEVLPLLSFLGTLVDPPATMVNAVGDNASAMMLTRMLYGKGWPTARKEACLREKVSGHPGEVPFVQEPALHDPQTP